MFKLNMIAVGAVLLLTCAFVWLMLYPGIDDLEVKQKQVEKKFREVDARQRAVGDVSGLYASIMSLRDKVAAFRRRLPTERKFGDFLNSLSRCLEESDIADYVLQPSQAIEVDPEKLPEGLELARNTTILPVAISFKSTTANVFDFLKRVDHLRRITHVDSLHIKNTESRPGTLKVEIVLHTFHQERPPE